ncbi:ABC-2 transporter permease [Shouchella patagoniensis]|uniref:ABC-2 transporter permease n=1 Tax=Shouchella patagoniensis TaxID=228576 RepID=UPI0009949631|nr:ABC-2 transporter permease [Shouchella patagoniensis]
MMGLLRKEWTVYRSSLMVLVGVIFLGAFLLGDKQLPVYAAVFIACLYAFISDGTDGANHTDMVIRSLPVTQKQIVMAKYLCSISIVVLFSLVIVVLNWILPFLTATLLLDWVLSIAMFGLFLALYYPLYYMIGSKVVHYGIHVFVIGSLVFWGFFLGGVSYDRLSQQIEQLGIPFTVPIILAGIASCLLVSCLLSIQIFQTKSR